VLPDVHNRIIRNAELYRSKEYRSEELAELQQRLEDIKNRQSRTC